MLQYYEAHSGSHSPSPCSTHPHTTSNSAVCRTVRAPHNLHRQYAASCIQWKPNPKPWPPSKQQTDGTTQLAALQNFLAHTPPQELGLLLLWHMTAGLHAIRKTCLALPCHSTNCLVCTKLPWQCKGGKHIKIHRRLSLTVHDQNCTAKAVSWGAARNAPTTPQMHPAEDTTVHQLNCCQTLCCHNHTIRTFVRRCSQSMPYPQVLVRRQTSATH